MTKIKKLPPALLDHVQDRDYQVVKGNNLIQKSRFQLSTQEQKIILYLISKIKPSDKEFQRYSFEIREFCKLCNIESDGGATYQYLKDTLKKLSDKSFWVKLDTGVEVLLRWIDGIRVNPKSGTVSMRLNEDMKPYLLELKEKFTQYSLVYILGMRSQYAIRLYEILKSYEYRGRWQVGIDELKRILMASEYERWSNFKQKVLDTALREIKELTDLEVDFAVIKKGRKFTDIEFIIKQKDDNSQTAAWLERMKVLDY
jgi:plasmid replication initiation protein